MVVINGPSSAAGALHRLRLPPTVAPSRAWSRDQSSLFYPTLLPPPPPPRPLADGVAAPDVGEFSWRYSRRRLRSSTRLSLRHPRRLDGIGARRPCSAPPAGCCGTSAPPRALARSLAIAFPDSASRSRHSCGQMANMMGSALQGLKARVGSVNAQHAAEASAAAAAAAAVAASGGERVGRSTHPLASLLEPVLTEVKANLQASRRPWNELVGPLAHEGSRGVARRDHSHTVAIPACQPSRAIPHERGGS